MSFFSRYLPAQKKKRRPLYFFNTLGKEKQEFEVLLNTTAVRVYNCGPTVYDVQHIGNLSAYVFADILRRTLEYNGYPVKQVINITDVGHLSDDGDEGEDKMTRGLKAAGLPLTLDNMQQLGERYTERFKEDLSRLNIDISRIQFPRASEHVGGQIAMIKTLEEKGYAYKIEDGVYFDTSRVPGYGVLGGVNLVELKERSRIGVKANKRSPTDFALWKFDQNIGWESPWGRGFPGWHIECSAMIHATLGRQIDIHTGGMEHIPIHHNNEIAQSEAVTGKKPLARFWLHRAHLQLEGAKIAKRDKNTVYLSEIIERGHHPLSLRYLFLGAHYRTPTNFTWEALLAAETAFSKLLAERSVLTDASSSPPPQKWLSKFQERVNDDLDTPGALATLWEGLRNAAYSSREKKAMLDEADRIFGLRLSEPDEAAKKLAKAYAREEVSEGEIPDEVKELLQMREAARKEKKWDEADSLRKELAEKGYVVEDGPSGPLILRK